MHTHKRIHIPIYGGFLHIFVTERPLDAVAYFRKRSFEINLHENVEAFADIDTIKNCPHYLMVVRPNCTTGTLAHEAAHVCDYIFDYIGAKHDFNNSEPYTYLLGFVVDVATEVLMSKKEKENEAHRRTGN